MVLDEEPMMQMENSPPRETKSMSRVEEEVGEIKSSKMSMGEMLQDVGGVSGGDVMSGMC